MREALLSHGTLLAQLHSLQHGKSSQAPHGGPSCQRHIELYLIHLTLNLPQHQPDDVHHALLLPDQSAQPAIL